MYSQTKRFFQISKVITKYKLFRLVGMLNPNNAEQFSIINSAQRDNLNKLAQNFRLALEELGPIFVKFGQLLSTRHELLPIEFINELSKLQDNVKPFDTSLVKDIIKTELKKDCDNIFTDFSAKPIASASVAQVHAAKLDNKEVVIKILRPNLKLIIDTDIKLLRLLISIVISIKSSIKRFKPDELIEELERVLHDEQDLLREAANASQIRRNFSNNDILYIPKMYWKYCTSNILVQEKISGISINNITELKNKKVDLKFLAKRGLELFFTQVFEHCLFHGDLHPGNIFVNADNPKDPKFYAVDFGIVGSLGPEEQYYLAHNLWAFVNRDYRKVAELHIESGWADPNARVDLFESAIRTVSEPILELPVSEISFSELLVNLFDVAKNFDMQLQPQLLVFKKSLINVEGMARKLDPELDLWGTCQPFIEQWMQNQVGIKKAVSKIKDSIPKLVSMASETPELLYLFLKSNVKPFNNNSIVNNTGKANYKNKSDSYAHRETMKDAIWAYSIGLILLAVAGFLLLNYSNIFNLLNKSGFTIENMILGMFFLYGIKGLLIKQEAKQESR